MTTYFIGIDGGGSTVRVILTDEQRQIKSSFQGATVNPSTVGRAVAAERIRTGLAQVLHQTGLEAEAIAALGIGVAGASNAYADQWLREVVKAILPDALIVTSSDNEIALVGALGKPLGILLLAGTGSVAFGINPAGEKLQVGGWGYLLGDEGSGFRLGLAALQATAQTLDHRHVPTPLTHAVTEYLSIEKAADLILWAYDRQQNRVPDIAKLARLVLENAESDPVAEAIIEEAAQDLVLHVETIRRELRFPEAELCFMGGILQRDNPLSRRVAALLGLNNLPQARYDPVIGAVILAQLERG